MRFTTANAEPITLDRLHPQTSREIALRLLVWLYAPITVALAVAVLVDDRTLLGESVWIKPLKFSVSIGLSGAAFLWLLGRIKPSPMKTAAVAASALALAVEQVLITIQASRGVRSHFNMAPGIDSTIYSMMGNFVGVVWVATLVLAVGLTRRRIADPVVRAVAVYGTWLVLLGASVGFVMVSLSKHSVGGVDCGAQLPIVGWNRNIGDLRPAHFVGLHALQALIVVAWIGRRRSWSIARTLQALAFVAIALGTVCVGLVAQALVARPVTSPTTLLVVGASLATAWFGHRRNCHPRLEGSSGRSPAPSDDRAGSAVLRETAA